jgi:hypothetical protein
MLLDFRFDNNDNNLIIKVISSGKAANSNYFAIECTGLMILAIILQKLQFLDDGCGDCGRWLLRACMDKCSRICSYYRSMHWFMERVRQENVRSLSLWL